MSTEKASRLKNSCSRSCLGLVSVMCRSWFCVAWVMSRGVTVMSRSCFRDALLMSRGCRDDVSVTSRCCFSGVMVMSRSCFPNALLWCLGDVSMTFRWCLSDVSVLFWWCLGLVSVLFCWCLRVVLVWFCWFCVGVLGMFQWRVGGISVFRWSLHDVWWWCCDVYDHEWVIVMAWCCLVDVAVLFFFFGDGVLIVWWWTLMNILIGFLSKIQNSNLNLYIVHLWANQCSCGSYVVGWCFKCFDVLGTSRACFREISVMCVDGAVMFMMMSGWWLGVVSLMLQCRCFFFGDGVLIVWWLTLMNILIGFLSKVSNSDLNLYIVHL